MARAEGIELPSCKITPAKRAAIITALKKNPNARQVAQKVGGVSNVTVMTIAKAEGIELAKNHRAAAAKRAKIIVALKKRFSQLPLVDLT